MAGQHTSDNVKDAPTTIFDARDVLAGRLDDATVRQAVEVQR
jgi:hypothetical protein